MFIAQCLTLRFVQIDSPEFISFTETILLLCIRKPIIPMFHYSIIP